VIGVTNFHFPQPFCRCEKPVAGAELFYLCRGAKKKGADDVRFEPAESRSNASGRYS
jgi:hypothetical protein